MGLEDFDRCLAFHSLSKRSNLPGLRSGFVAGDADLIERFLAYRTYHGCSMSEPIQIASALAWSDEEHVSQNRKAYDARFQAVSDVFADSDQFTTPAAGFYLWPNIGLDDQAFTRRLLIEQNVAVLPGSFLAREQDGRPNPGKGHLRLALVAGLEDCVEAAERIAASLSTHEADRVSAPST